MSISNEFQTDIWIWHAFIQKFSCNISFQSFSSSEYMGDDVFIKMVSENPLGLWAAISLCLNSNLEDSQRNIDYIDIWEKSSRLKAFKRYVSISGVYCYL